MFHWGVDVYFKSMLFWSKYRIESSSTYGSIIWTIYYSFYSRDNFHDTE